MTTEKKWFDLSGKVAIVTGGTRGLGRAIAGSLAEHGADVVVTGRSQEQIDEVCRGIAQASGRRAVGLAGDLADPETPQRVVDFALARLGRLDVLVNNAGINIRGAIETRSVADFDQIVAVNVRAPWLFCRAAAPVFKGQRSGRVVNIGSTLSSVAMADRSLYCLSKGAVAQLTRELAVEWGPLGITVNAVCPGPFETEMNKVLTQDPPTYQRFANLTALGRWARMDEIGPLVVFLASDGSSYLTGALVYLDGGWTAL